MSLATVSPQPNLGALIDAIPHAVAVVDEEMTFTFVNSAAEQFFGMGAAMLAKSTLKDHLPADHPLVALLSKVIRLGVSVTEYGLTLSTPKLGQRRIDLHAAPVVEMPGSALLMIEERSIAEKIDRQLTHRGAARSVAGMAAVLAHEIKNPLSGIRGAAQLLEQGASEDDRSLTQLICRETDRICGLVDQMELFGDSRPIAREPVNIHHVLDHVRRIAEAGFAKSLKIVETYDPSLPPVYGNADQLVQVFLNLVKNAAEALAERTDGEVDLVTAYRPGVRLSTPGSSDRLGLPLEVCVRDNGGGVPDELRPYMFDPFVSTKANGTGLGLALVAKIIGDHGGVIECTRENGRTVFRTLLPIHQADPQEGPDQ
ncbi:MAG: ATP-binding protein [Pseudomonadota bacterium]